MDDNDEQVFEGLSEQGKADRVADLVRASTYQSAAIPDAIAGLLASKIAQAQAAAGEWSLGRTETVAERRKREDEQQIEATIDRLALYAEEARREREQWAREQHSFAGVIMSGAAWGELGDDIKRGGELRNWLVSRLMRDGRTKEQAEDKADQIGNLATILAKPESERTSAERAQVEAAKSDPTIIKVMPELAEQQRNLGVGKDVTATLSLDQDASVGSRVGLFASAPDLTTGYKTAVAAVTPLDAPKPAALASATPAPMPSAAAGLDV